MTTFKKLDEQIIELADTIAREMRKVLELAKSKADKAETETALGSVNTELAKKANATDVSTALSEMGAEKVGYTVLIQMFKELCLENGATQDEINALQ